GCVRDESSRWRIDLGQSATGGPKAAGKWIVATRIQNHDVQAILCIVHVAEQKAHVNGRIFRFDFALDVRFDWNKIVTPFGLQSVASVIEKSRATCLQLLPKLAHQALHLALADVYPG